MGFLINAGDTNALLNQNEDFWEDQLTSISVIKQLVTSNDANSWSYSKFKWLAGLRWADVKMTQYQILGPIYVTERVSNRKAVVAMARKREVPGSSVTYGTGPLACLSLFPVAEIG